MLQSILVYLIVILAVIAAVYKMVSAFTAEDKNSPCGGCASCLAKKELLRNVQ